MEEIDDFEAVIRQHEINNVFWAVFDGDTGKVLGIYPDSSADQFLNKIEIEKKTAELIQSGNIKLTNCFINLDESELVILESNSLVKIDDVLHRVIEHTWAPHNDADLYIHYSRIDNTLTLSLADYLGGTKALNNKKILKKINRDNTTAITLIASSYNDPNEFYYLLSLDLNELIDNDKIFLNICLPEKFSIYTRRLFKHYIMEIV